MIVKQSDIELVEEFQKERQPITLAPFFIEPFFMYLLKNYFKLLGTGEYAVDTITQDSYIKNILETNQFAQEAKEILYVNEPINCLKIAVKKLAIVKEIYQNLSLFDFF